MLATKSVLEFSHCLVGYSSLYHFFHPSELLTELVACHKVAVQCLVAFNDCSKGLGFPSKLCFYDILAAFRSISVTFQWRVVLRAMHQL